MFFASDNAGPAHPRVMDALAAANEGYAMPYGKDPIMARVTERVRAFFEAPEAAVYLVGTGTACNALLLAAMTKPWETIFCSDVAHIYEDECGAPEFFTGGARLTLVDAPHGLMTPEGLERAVSGIEPGDVQSVQRGPLSLTSVSERGTVYDLAHLRGLCDIAGAAGLSVHLDGARLCNALVSLDCTPAELTWKSGVDTVSFGGTKNGLLGVEAAVIFDPEIAWEFELRRKRAGHLFSKHRYLSAQMDAYLEGDLWREMAGRANAAAERLARGLEESRHGRLLHPRMANVVYCEMPAERHERLRAEGAQFYSLGPSTTGDGWHQARLVCDWSATPEGTDRFLSVLNA